MIISLLFAMFISYPMSVLTVPQVEAAMLPKVEKVWTVEELKAIATQKAKEHGLKIQRFLNVIECESGWNTHARGDFVKGTPTSFGPVQIHRPVEDWGISITEADTPDIAFELMAQKWEIGEAWRWSCHELLYP